MSKFICKASGDANATNTGVNTPDVIANLLSTAEVTNVQAPEVGRTSLSDYWRQAEPAERVYLVSQMAQIASAVLLAVMLFVTLKRR